MIYKQKQRSKDKDKTPRLKHSQPLTLKNTSSKTISSTLSTNIQTIQLTLVSIHTHRKKTNCINPLVLKMPTFLAQVAVIIIAADFQNALTNVDICPPRVLKKFFLSFSFHLWLLKSRTLHFRRSPRAHLHEVGMLWSMSKIVNQPSLPTPVYSVPVSISIFLALSTVFHSLNSLDNSPLSHIVFAVLILPCWSFRLYISSWKSPSSLI